MSIIFVIITDTEMQKHKNLSERNGSRMKESKSSTYLSKLYRCKIAY